MTYHRTRGHVDCDGVDGVSRRNFMKAGVAGFMGLGLMDIMKASALAGGAGQCDSVILIWLAGGPSHIDTFDPKPGQPSAGMFKPINTSIDGIQICEHMPNIAKNLKHASLIRSFTNKEGSHARATYEMHTGYKPLGSIKHPSLGSWVAHTKATENKELPSYVSIGRSAFGAGFLGSKVAPFLIGDPNNPTRNIDLHKGIDAKRFRQRLNLLKSVDSPFRQEMRDKAVDEYGIQFQGALNLMRSKSVEAFNLEKETKRIERYGNTRLGKGLIIAKRLVKAGVRFVEVSLGGWDNHAGIFERIPTLCNQLDPALGNLLEDLNAEGTLKRTMVICTGEFGRTPKINGGAGRDHYPKVWSGLVAGGGIKAGYVHGSSDKTGAAVKDKPVKPGQLHATMFELLGINYVKEHFTDQGRPIRVVDTGKPIKDLMA